MTDRYQPLRDAAHGALRLMFPDDLKLLLAALLAERDALANKLGKCGGENCMGWRDGDIARWVREERLLKAERERDVAVEDASRYRWIAAHCRSTAEHWGGRWSIVVEGPPPTKHDEEDAFDAAIDAAREAGR